MFNSGIRGRRSRDVEGITNPQTKFVQTKYPQPYISGYSVSGLDDTALDTAGGQTVIVTGTGFATGVSATLGGTQIGAVSLVSPTQISFTAPAKSAGTYSLVVYNSTGGAAILVPGLTYSSFPTYTTAAGSIGSLYETKPINTSVVATSDSAITYTLASGTLPAGATLASDGTITGTAPADSGSTTYTFSIKATDSELQDVTRTFTLTVNTDVVSWVTPASGATINLDSSAYSQALNATDAAGYAVSYTANALPTGLTLSSGTISGTPTVEGTVSTLLTATAATTTRSATNTITWVVSLSDPYWKFNTVVLTANASSQTQSFVSDKSINNAQLTIAGDTRAQSFNPYQFGYYSVFHGTTTNGWQTPAGSTTNIIGTSTLNSTSTFTFEAWIFPLARHSGGGAALGYLFGAMNTTGGQTDWCIGPDSTGKLTVFWYNSGNVVCNSTNLIPIGQWTHVAVCFSVGVITMFINGVKETLTGTTTATTTSGTALGYVSSGGYTYSGTTWQGFNGYISNLRVVKNIVLYPGNFTPSTTPLLPVPGTTLLMGQSNKFVDNSPNNTTLTLTNTPQISLGNPFTTQYVPNTANYSTFFNGSSDLITLTPGTFGANDFTIEMWVFSNVSTAQIYFNNFRWYNGLTPGSLAIGYDGTNFYVNCYTGAGNVYDGAPNFTITKAGTILNTWRHIAVVRQGATLYLCIDGVATSLAITNNTALNLETRTTYWIGGYGDNQGGPGWWMSGCISNFRIVKGQALYTGNFTPSAAPLTKTTVGTSGTNVASSLTGTVNLLTFQSSPIIDNSNDARALTLTTTVKPVAMAPFASAYYSTYFTGGTDYLTLPSNQAAFSMGTGDFTVEMWIYINSLSAQRTLYDTVNSGDGTGTGRFGLQVTTGGVLQVYSLAGTILTSGGTLTAGVWYHIAYVRISNSGKLYVNGVQVNSTYTDNNNYAVGTTSRPIIGINGYDSSSFPMQGHISNLRVVKGVGVYTGAFTVPTSPLTVTQTAGTNIAAITGTQTSLLTCQSLYIIDNSTNLYTLTVGSTTKTSAVAPFTQPTGYSGTAVSTTLGSGYFDGSGDYLIVPYSASHANIPADFTLEYWFFTTTTSGTQALVSHRNANTGSAAYVPFLVWIASGTLTLYVSSNNSSWDLVNAASLGTIVINQWYHFAYTRIGSTCKIFLNGVQVYTFTSAASFTTAQPLQIGMTGPGETNDAFNGYICDIRFVKGTGIYASNFVPGFTSTLTNVTNTQLLTLQTNGAHNNSAFQDNSGFSNIVTRNGDATNGTFSPYSDNWSVLITTTSGSGNVIAVAAAPYNNTSGTSGNFTIECWAMKLGNSSLMVVAMLSGVTTSFCRLNSDGSAGGLASWSTAQANHNTFAPIGTWFHLAASRNNGTVYTYINGVMVNSGANTTNYTFTGGSASTQAQVGNYNNNTGQEWVGYISNYRIVNGTGLYPNGTTFTPPTGPLSPVPGTIALLCARPTLTDSSLNNLALTVTGTPQVQRITPFAAASSQKYFSTKFDGTTGAYFTATGKTNLALGSGDFTVECWIYKTVSGVTDAIYTGTRSPTATGGLGWKVATDDRLAWNTSSSYASGTTAITLNVWHHIAMTRQSGTLNWYLDGVLDYTGSLPDNFSNPTAAINITDDPYYGRLSISDFRIVVGTAVYTSNFSVPTAPLTVIPNTSLLLSCTSNFVKDSASNPATITQYGTTQRQVPMGPFSYAVTSKSNYTPSVFGGSMFFDGTGDYLSVPYSVNWGFTADFTVECWIYWASTSHTAYAGILSCAQGSGWTGWQIIYDNTNNYFRVEVNNSTLLTGSGITLYPYHWYHIAFVRSGTACTLYYNGVPAGTATSSATFDATNASLYVGCERGANAFFNGYITDVRISKVALYKTNFYPWTTPLIASQAYNSTFLLNGTSSSIVDQTRNLNIETLGDAKVTQFSPYNGTYYSVYFDGSNGSYLTAPNNAAFKFGAPSGNTNDFTVEFWLFQNNTAIAYVAGTGYSTNNYWNVGTNRKGSDGSNAVGYLQAYITDSFYIEATSGFTAGTWHHIVLNRTGTTVSLFLDGSRVATGTSSIDPNPTGVLELGGDGASLARYLNGYISNFRIIKGSTQPYSATNTTLMVPTTPLTAITGTTVLTAQSNKFVDTSATALVMTGNSVSKVATQNPFQVNSGISYYFDGTGDYLSFPLSQNDIIYGDFTVEFWLYNTTTTTGSILYLRGQAGASAYAGIRIGVENSTVYFLLSTSGSSWDINTGDVGTVSINIWNHVAITRSGTTVKVYVNGTVLGTTYSITGTLYNSGPCNYIGAINTGSPAQFFNGYLADLRITNGYARYTTSFTLPAVPVKTN